MIINKSANFLASFLTIVRELSKDKVYLAPHPKELMPRNHVQKRGRAEWPVVRRGALFGAPPFLFS
jgi:hypothetical protein